IFDLRQETRALLACGNFFGFERFQFLRASLNGIAFGIAVGVSVGGFDDAEVVEKESHATWRAKRAGLKQVANLRRRAVAVFCQTLDYDRHLVRTEPLV